MVTRTQGQRVTWRQDWLWWLLCSSILLNVIGLILPRVIGRKIFDVESAAVVGAALDGAIFKDACGSGCGGVGSVTAGVSLSAYLA